MNKNSKKKHHYNLERQEFRIYIDYTNNTDIN